jgi:hypothetical protein
MVKVDVGLGHRAMINDPLPDRDLPHRIGIDQQVVSGAKKERIDGNADQQRQQPAQGACGIIGMPDG